MQASVLPSTLIRFANAFGFSSFNEMKQIFRRHLMEETFNYTERAHLFLEPLPTVMSYWESQQKSFNVFTMVNPQALQQLVIPNQLRAVGLDG